MWIKLCLVLILYAYTLWGSHAFMLFLFLHVHDRSQCWPRVSRGTDQPGGIRAGEKTQHVVSVQPSKQLRYVILLTSPSSPLLYPICNLWARCNVSEGYYASSYNLQVLISVMVFWICYTSWISYSSLRLSMLAGSLSKQRLTHWSVFMSHNYVWVC